MLIGVLVGFFLSWALLWSIWPTNVSVTDVKVYKSGYAVGQSAHGERPRGLAASEACEVAWSTGPGDTATEPYWMVGCIRGFEGL